MPGPGQQEHPRIAVVVMGYQNSSTISAAIASVLEQRPPPDEVVVVTSGGDDTAALVARDHPEVTVLDSPERLLPGGARNRGVSVVDTDVVAFLAADCWAEPGWVAGRARAHGLGHDVVATAIALPDDVIGLASYLTKFAHRMPTRAPGLIRWPDAGAHGASYHRRALELLGGFDESMLSGEDSDANARLARAGVPIFYEPSVVTGHGEPARMVALVRDQVRRGREYERWLRSHGGATGRAPAPVVWWRTFRPVWRAAWRHGRPVRGRLIRAAPVLAVACSAKTAGRLAERRSW